MEICESLVMEDVQHNIDTLKIDCAFVIEMDTPEGLGPGIHLHHPGACGEMQGYLFNKPVTGNSLKPDP